MPKYDWGGEVLAPLDLSNLSWHTEIIYSLLFKFNLNCTLAV